MKTKALYEQFMMTSMVAGFEPIEVESAQGCTVVATDGRRYLDCFAGIAVCNAGHGHPKVLAAAREQMEKLVHCCTYLYYNARAGELAAALAAALPGSLQKSFFANSGAEAVEGALRLAKQFTKRRELIALSQSFHGRSYATLSITGNSARKKGAGPYMAGVAFAPAPYCYRCPLGHSGPAVCGLACARYLESTIQCQTSDDVAAFIAEPVMGEGGIIVPPDGYFEAVQSILHRHGILFIADEVQSGFGRTGRLFAIEHSAVIPDILVAAKGIADGFPLASFTARAEVADAFTPGSHLSTFGGNPVCCAAALANLAVMDEERLPQKAAQRGARLMAGLRDLQEGLPVIGDVRGKGLMIGIELVSDVGKTPAPDLAAAVRRACRQEGVLVGLGGSLGNVVRLQPPLTISEEECDQVLKTVEKALGIAQRGSGL